jgi:hypothetical protein
MSELLHGRYAVDLPDATFRSGGVNLRLKPLHLRFPAYVPATRHVVVEVLDEPARQKLLGWRGNGGRTRSATWGNLSGQRVGCLGLKL